MGIITDTKSSVIRIRGYATRMKGLLAQHGIHNVRDLKRVAKEPSFQTELATFWEQVITSKGGKVTVTVISSTIALSRVALASPR
jgi:Leu/Phe-tRNA-protein transferase